MCLKPQNWEFLLAAKSVINPINLGAITFEFKEVGSCPMWGKLFGHIRWSTQRKFNLYVMVILIDQQNILSRERWTEKECI